MNIIIYDDEAASQSEWRNTLRKHLVGHRIDAPLPATLFDELEVLQKRREAARAGKPGSSHGKSCFDTADLLIVDYDLLKLQGAGYLTGEEVTYLVRCYSRCGIVVALNQFFDADFDLSLRGHLHSFADLNINATHLSRPGLWTQPWTGLRPWHWPLLPWAVAAYERRVEFLKTRLDEPILRHLGLEQIVPMFPRSLLGFLTNKGAPKDVTFRDFVGKSGNGLRAKDKPLDDRAISRIAAARIWKWLERGVLPGQDLLVDAPHLAQRCPSVLTGGREELKSWNATTSLMPKPSRGLRRKLAESFRFQAGDWLSRDAWIWPQMDAEVPPELLHPSNASGARFVFCEDLSEFRLGRECQEFVADLPSPFVRRFVANSDLRKKLLQGSPLSYGPAFRLAI